MKKLISFLKTALTTSGDVAKDSISHEKQCKYESLFLYLLIFFILF